MRITFALAGLAALAFAQSAAAAPVIGPISFSPELQTALEEDIGIREGEKLQRWTSEAVGRALARHGAENASVTVEIDIVDADPNRPTMNQLSENPDLDAIRSISIGGAELHGVLRGADGEVITEVTHRNYDMTLDDVVGGTTWEAARQAIRQFAEKVADAYVANAR
jgi:hypothetical protein